MPAVRSPDPLALAEILEEDVELVEVCDAVPASVRDFAAGLIRARRLGEPLQCVCAAGEDGGDPLEDLEQGLGNLADLDACPAFVSWARDWIDGFACLNGVPAVGLRMSHLREPMCPRFHVDQVPTRLIVTLAGPGTEWLPAEFARRDGAGVPEQRPEPARIRQLADGSLGLFKGSGFEDGWAPGVVHRSPPARGDRIVMTLDALC